MSKFVLGTVAALLSIVLLGLSVTRSLADVGDAATAPPAPAVGSGQIEWAVLCTVVSGAVVILLRPRRRAQADD